MGGFLVTTLIVLAGCDSSGTGESIYDPDATDAPDPVIATVSPEPGSLVLAGIDAITITGENFSPIPSNNLVYFDAVQGEVLEASPTELLVQTPNTPKPDAELRVTVIGAENFSNSVSYRLVAAAERIGDLAIIQVPSALGVDDQGAVYIPLVDEGVNVGVQKITPDGERTQFAPTTTLSQRLQDLAFGPDQSLYGVFGLGALVQIPEGGPLNFVGVLSDVNEPLTSLTFDTQGGAWLGSDAGNLFRFDLATNAIEPFVLDADIEDTQVRDLAVYGGSLYVALTQQEKGAARIGKIVRFPINGATLGPREDFALISAEFAVNPLAMAFAADGSMLVGTSNNVDNDTALLLVDPSGSAEPFYAGIVLGPVQDLAWGPDTGAYALGFVAGLEATETRRNTRLLDSLSPIPDLIRIETRLPGAP